MLDPLERAALERARAALDLVLPEGQNRLRELQQRLERIEKQFIEHPARQPRIV